MGASYDSFGRTNQKRRTRAALRAAAAALMQQGETPTVAQAAEAALISKSTAHRYFPTQEALVAEVLLERIVGPDLEAVYAASRLPGSAASRLERVVRADHAFVTKHEAAFRTALRAMLGTDTEDGAEMFRRPGNRLRYLSAALAPVHDRLGPDQRERLVCALSMCVGIESMIVARDICGMSSAEAEETKLWAAGALLAAALEESPQGPRT